jgi:hypothetical protein
MSVYVPLDLPKVEPDNWDRWVDFFEKNKSVTVKSIWDNFSGNIDRQVVYGNYADVLKETSATYTGFNAIDVYRKFNNPGEKSVHPSINLVRLEEEFPKMSTQILSILDNFSVQRISILQFTDLFKMHRDFSPISKSIRCSISQDIDHGFNFFHSENFIEMRKMVLPQETNWFMFEDMKCLHSYEPKTPTDNYLITIFGQDETEFEKFLARSKIKFSDYILD